MCSRVSSKSSSRADKVIIQFIRECWLNSQSALLFLPYDMLLSHTDKKAALKYPSSSKSHHSTLFVYSTSRVSSQTTSCCTDLVSKHNLTMSTKVVPTICPDPVLCSKNFQDVLQSLVWACVHRSVFVWTKALSSDLTYDPWVRWRHQQLPGGGRAQDVSSYSYWVPQRRRANRGGNIGSMGSTNMPSYVSFW